MCVRVLFLDVWMSACVRACFTLCECMLCVCVCLFRFNSYFSLFKVWIIIIISINLAAIVACEKRQNVTFVWCVCASSLLLRLHITSFPSNTCLEQQQKQQELKTTTVKAAAVAINVNNNNNNYNNSSNRAHTHIHKYLQSNIHTHACWLRNVFVPVCACCSLFCVCTFNFLIHLTLCIFIMYVRIECDREQQLDIQNSQIYWRTTKLNWT